MMDLQDTVAGMTSSNYKDRFRSEYYQTKIRYEKLRAFCNKIEAAEHVDKKPPKHDCPIHLLRSQQECMGGYLHILEVRAEIEGIDLTS